MMFSKRCQLLAGQHPQDTASWLSAVPHREELPPWAFQGGDAVPERRRHAPITVTERRNKIRQTLSSGDNTDKLSRHIHRRLG